MKTKAQAKEKGTHWPRILTIVTMVSATLACSIIETSTPTAQPTPAPTWTPIPTWTPVPTATPTPKPTTGEISGQVIDASSSSPIPNANIFTNPPTISVTADAQGRYVIPEVLPGVYTITATKPGYTSASVEIAVTAGKTTTADVHLMASQVSTEISSAIVIWQVGVNDQSDTEFGGSLGREPLFYRVPSGWASMTECADCWSEFPSQLNPPEDWPDMPQTVHILCDYPASTSSLMLRVVVNGRDRLQGERLRVLFDETLIDDVVVTSMSPAWDTFEFDLPTIIPGEHTVTLENSGGGGLTFDYVQVLTSNTDYSPPVPDPTAESSLADGLVAYYPFNGNADDESGNGNHGTVHGARLAADRFENANSAYDFDGVDDYIAIPDNPTLDISEEVTLSAWVHVKSLEGGEGIVSKVWTNSRSPWELGIDQSTRRFRVMGGSDYRKNLYHAIDNNPIELNQWYHIVGVASDGLAVLYINGIETASESYSGSFWKNEHDVFIGTRWTHQRGHHFNGTIDDIRIYNRALSEAEIQALYGEGGAAGLAAHYPFNGNADDESGNGNHGTVHGATLAPDRFETPNSAYEFDGVDDYIEIADSNSLDIEEQITIAAWVLFYSNPGGSSRIVEKPYTHCGYPWVMYTLRMCCNANRFAFDVTSLGSNHVLDSAHGQSAEEWHHIVGTYDGEIQRIYVDGVLDGLSGHTGMLDTNDQPVAIGGSSMCIGHPRFEQQFHGLIDDVRIYNRVLSESEIQALHREGGWASEGASP